MHALIRNTRYARRNLARFIAVNDTDLLPQSLFINQRNYNWSTERNVNTLQADSRRFFSDTTKVCV